MWLDVRRKEIGTMGHWLGSRRGVAWGRLPRLISSRTSDLQTFPNGTSGPTLADVRLRRSTNEWAFCGRRENSTTRRHQARRKQVLSKSALSA
jgi:hypothetical protein